MRYRKSGRHLSRTDAHCKAMFQNMVVPLPEHELIKTTPPRTKELRHAVELPVILIEEDSIANRRLASGRIRSGAAIGRLFNNLGKCYVNRPGGYLYILKYGFRAGDSALMAYAKLADRPVGGEVIEATE